MPFRFRRSIKIAPGLRLSFGKKSASLRLGVRGMGISKSTTGRTTASAGIPGTGLWWTKSLSGALGTRHDLSTDSLQQGPGLIPL